MQSPRLDFKRLEQKVKQAQDNDKNKQTALLLFWCILRAELDLVSEWLQARTAACLGAFEAMDLTPISKLGPLLKQPARAKPAQSPNPLQLFVSFCDELLQIRKCMVDNFLLASQMLESYEGIFKDDKAPQFVRDEMLEAEFIKSPKLLGLLEKARFIALVILQQKEGYTSKGLVKSICAKCSHRMADPVVLSCGDTICTWCLTSNVAAVGKLCPLCPVTRPATRYYVPHTLQGVLFDEEPPPERNSSLRALRFLNPIEICSSWGAAQVLAQPPKPPSVAPSVVSSESFSQQSLELEPPQNSLNRLATWAASLFSPGISNSTFQLMEGSKEDLRLDNLKPVVLRTGSSSQTFAGLSPPIEAAFVSLSPLDPRAGLGGSNGRVSMDSEAVFCEKQAVGFHLPSPPLDLFFHSDTKEPDLSFPFSFAPDLAVGPPLDDTFPFNDPFTDSPNSDVHDEDGAQGSYLCQELSTCLDTHWIKPCLETHGPDEEGVMYFQSDELGEGMCENPAHHLPKLEDVALHDRLDSANQRTSLFPKMSPCLVPSECPAKLVRRAPGPNAPAQHFHIYPHQHAREHEHIKRKNDNCHGPPPKRHTTDGLSSCHQCKCKKLTDDCALCSGGKLCRKKFCSTCLKKHYNSTLENIRLLDSWMCPACTGICLCAACTRDRNNWTPQSPKLSCHQCKCNKQPSELTFCASDASVRKCRKKYCRNCLLQYGNIARPEASTSWECPACRDFCSCATCKRRREAR